MLKRAILATVTLGLCAFAYVAAPFYTAWTIRSAAKAGDVAYLSEKIDWTTIKPGLKRSLTKLALSPASTRASTTAPQKPGLWRRIKNYSTRIFISSFVDRYANPDGFETLVTYGRMVRGKSKSDDHLPLTTRIARVWSRVHRADFKSLTRFELDLADKDDANRIYCGVFKLTGWNWKLTDLRIEILPNAQLAQLATTLKAN